MIYFTSDLHLGHANMIRIKNRPFANVDEMNKTLIQNINDTCKPRDTLVILGDIAMNQSVEKTEELIQRMNPRLVLIRGNHDKKYDPRLFLGVHDYLRIKLYKRPVILCHYPFEEWDGFFHKSVHLHGHQHNLQEYNIRMRQSELLRFDVGVDANYYRPVSAKEVFDFFGLDTDDFGNSMKEIDFSNS